MISAESPAVAPRCPGARRPARFSRPGAFIAILALCGLGATSAGTGEPAVASHAAPIWVIVGAQIVDGSGRPAFRANLRVVGDRIEKIGKFQPREGEQVIPAEGMVLAPGFIDLHNHSDEGLEAEPLAPTQVSQGITTLVLGPDGGSPLPLGDFLARLAATPPALNILALVGHGSVRARVLGEDYRRPATPAEVEKMKALVEEAMRQGAFGLSSGLEYDPGFYSTTGELVALAGVARRFHGFYMSHIRDEGDGILGALDEAIAIGRQAKIPVQVSHLKLATAAVWGKTAEVIRRFEQARRRGVDIAADSYPYDAWASTITVLVPNRRHDDPASVEKGLRDVGGAENVLLVNCKPHPDYEGRTLKEIAASRGLTPVALYQEIVAQGGAQVVVRSMQEEDVRTFYAQPWVAVASDGGIGLRHPRSAGSFPRVLGLYVRERGWLSLEEAIRRMTSLPARRLGLRDRGRLRPGYRADLVLFDPRTVRDRSTFSEPFRLPEGIEKVFVNGVLVWDGGRPTGARPGRVLRRCGKQVCTGSGKGH